MKIDFFCKSRITRIFQKKHAHAVNTRLRDIFVLTAIALIMNAWAATQTNAAAFRLEDGEVCDLSLNERIEVGDAQALKKFLLDTPYPPKNGRSLGSMKLIYGATLCLNSPGGSLVEAAEIAAIVYSGHPTVIRAGEQCLSACAWIFMLGRKTQGDSLVTGRSMSVYATLGFHGLSFEIPDGEYNNQELSHAVDAMNKAFSEILKLARGETPATQSIDYDLIQFAMATSGDSFFYIDKVGQALRWQIDVFDAANFDKTRYLTRAAELNACNNARRSFLYYDYAYGDVYYEAKRREITEKGFLLDPGGDVYFVCEGSRLENGGYRVCHTYNYNQEIVGCISSPVAMFRGDTSLNVLGGAEGARMYTQLTTASVIAAEQRTTAKCSLEKIYARIANVNEYTNLRSRGGLANPVIARVPLQATVTQPNPGRYYATQRCLEICRGDNQRAIQQCIDNNEVWIEAAYTNRTGFLSRKFLEAVQ